MKDDTTLIKLSRKYGEDTLRDLKDALVLKLKEKKVIRGRTFRILPQPGEGPR